MNTNQAPGDSRQGTAPLWSNKRITDEVHTLALGYKAHHLLNAMRDEYEHALYDLRNDVAIREKHVAKLEAQLTRAGWEWAAAEDRLERIREKLRDMPQTFDDLGRHMYGDR